MQVRQYAVPGLVVMAVTLWTLGCGEMPTSPDQPALAKGKPSTPDPRIELVNLDLASNILTIGGASVDYTVDIVNAGGKRTGVILQAEVGQLGADGVTSAVRGAGGTTVDCGKELGLLPHGTCSVSFTTLASNTTGGFGTLIAGPATLILRVLTPEGSQLAGLTAPITLQ